MPIKRIDYSPNICIEFNFFFLFQYVTDNRYYVVKYSSVTNQKDRYFNATDLNCMIDDLRPNTPYEFTVKVVKGNIFVEI